MNKRKVIVTGSSGQLGQYLIQYLQENTDCEIIGTIRHKSVPDEKFIFDTNRMTFELMDLSDVHSIENLIIKYKPEFFINTAANAFVGESWQLPVQHQEQNCIAVLHMLEAIKRHSSHTRFFNMGSSEEIACCDKKVGPQNESSRISPRSPYGCSKAAARMLIKVYRESFNLYVIQGITYNFESPLRGEKYVTKKVTKGVARIYHAIKNNKPFEPIELGNLDSYRSWQSAKDVAVGIWMMLNQEKFNNELKNIPYTQGSILLPFAVDLRNTQELSKYVKEYVLSVSDVHTVRDLVELSFSKAGIDGTWIKGKNPEDEIYTMNNGREEKYKNAKNHLLVKINPKFLRPLDVTYLHGDSSAAKRDLGWEPTVSFDELIGEMVGHDIKTLSQNNP